MLCGSLISAIIIDSSMSWLSCIMIILIDANPKLENYQGCKPFYP